MTLQVLALRALRLNVWPIPGTMRSVTGAAVEGNVVRMPYCLPKASERSGVPCVSLTPVEKWVAVRIFSVADDDVSRSDT